MQHVYMEDVGLTNVYVEEDGWDKDVDSMSTNAAVGLTHVSTSALTNKGVTDVPVSTDTNLVLEEGAV